MLQPPIIKLDGSRFSDYSGSSSDQSKKKPVIVKKAPKKPKKQNTRTKSAFDPGDLRSA